MINTKLAAAINTEYERQKKGGSLSLQANMLKRIIDSKLKESPSEVEKKLVIALTIEVAALAMITLENME